MGGELKWRRICSDMAEEVEALGRRDWAEEIDSEGYTHPHTHQHTQRGPRNDPASCGQTECTIITAGKGWHLKLNPVVGVHARGGGLGKNNGEIVPPSLPTQGAYREEMYNNITASPFLSA